MAYGPGSWSSNQWIAAQHTQLAQRASRSIDKTCSAKRSAPKRGIGPRILVLGNPFGPLGLAGRFETVRDIALTKAHFDELSSSVIQARRIERRG